MTYQTDHGNNVSTDIFTLDAKDYLPHMNSNTVIRKLKVHFARFGVLDILRSNNAGQYTSDIISTFSKDWNFE